MITRIAAIMPLAFSVLLLTGCGDAGDHFGEFRPTNSRVVPVAKVTLSMPTYNGQPGVYPVQVTAYEAAGNPVPLGEQYAHPIVLTSGGTTCIATFGTDPKSPMTFGVSIDIPNTTTLAYANMTCSPTNITASDADLAKPVTASF